MNPIRKAAETCLPDAKGIFLRCDRGDGLYVTNAPSRTRDPIDWEAAGFHAQGNGRITFLVPDERWIKPFCEWLRTQVRAPFLARAVENACFGEVDAEDLWLWMEGIKRLELHGDADMYEKLIRKRAAVCLRERSGGGTIVVCALMVDLMNEGGQTR